MALSLGLTNLILFFVAGFLLYYHSATFRYYFKVCFLNGWMLGMSLAVLPVVALRGRDVANMRVLRLVMLPVKYILGIQIRVQGATNLNLKGPYVVVANHQGNVDFLGMFQILPERCTLIAKKELFYLFTIGIACWLSGFLLVDCKKAVDSIISVAADTMVHENLRMWVFLEGPRNSPSAMLPFKDGVFHLAVKAQVPVIPVVMSSYQHFLKEKTKRFTSGKVTIRVLPPVNTEGLGPADVLELTEHVQKMMRFNFDEISGEVESKLGNEPESAKE
ncbi:1-acyl-sn-glycerol-3-phosphate acyltransferase alpha-like [Tiliqua scincoides]|uniref:1-acyl-sn-glycerol-3-phosphate acyltransferase alpha-like n=1 Tax=Tiliqua scincoides TaxID=71010 RepID=UPI0034620232